MNAALPHITVLTCQLAHQVVDDLVALERLASAQFGLEFSDDVWDADSFLSERPGKWTYSRAVLTEDGHAIAFWIASASEDPRIGVYTHRIVVHAEHRRRGLLKEMWRSVVAEARQDGQACMSLSVSVRNASNTFYENEGCSRLRGEALRAYVQAKGLDAQILEERIREQTGHEKYIYVLPLQ
jgi:ribosomal protein S18 acetylase RimI-like enzyme